MVFSMTRPGREPTTYHEEADMLTTDPTWHDVTVDTKISLINIIYNYQTS